ncbi:MAG TPA: Rieske 2Fe-2S domain-containing protein [Vicinamibacteria bacterium]|nr:Rieske 2Fe-2S domain-containing protein [Vicinamibacteria bacterium]
MADEKDPSTPKSPAPGAEPAAVGAPPTRPPDTAAAHPAGTAAGSTPPLPTPPMTAATGPGGVQAAPAPRSNAVSGVSAAAAAKPAPAAPAPAATTSAKPAGAEGVSRRGFLKWTTVGWVAFSAACTSGLVASTRFMFPNVLFEPPQSFKVGFPSEYTVGEVDTRWKDAYSVWIVRNSEGFYALIAVCTHLGCSPNWLAAENKFKCPCHGSGFYKTGINFEGPAPRPLERARIVLADDGQILVDKSVKFQQEKAEWTKEESFLKV